MACPFLEKLDLSYNFLRNVDYIVRLKKLETLYVHFNKIQDLMYLDDLSFLTQLKNLSIEGNSFSTEPDYRHEIISKLKNL